MTTVRTTCPYCGVGCGVLASPQQNGRTQIEGDPLHPANYGRLCVKGSSLGETLGRHGRLLHPQVHQKQVTWDVALDTVAQGFERIIRESGPQAVAFYVSGQLLTEDYYVANKFVKGWLGTANIDTNSRLCMSSAVAGHKRAFGEDCVPICYEDLEIADLIVLVGANIAWCHPIIAQRIAKAREQRPGMKVVVIDPRRTATCEGADLHLPIRAGSDVALFNGLLLWLNDHEHLNEAFIAAHTNDFPEALAAARLVESPAAVATTCGLPMKDVLAFYQLFASTERVITAFSMGVNQSSSGTDKVNAIINCHLASGRIGRPGMGPFSITGQPNAMGGREVGGLANMLAAHMDLGRPEHRDTVQTFWGSPRIANSPGLKAVDLFHAIEAGSIRAVWIMATNPVVSLPDADQVKRALRKCDLVVISDCIEKTDTTAFGHVLLPATGWAEKDGTVTNSERRITRQHAFVPESGEARHDWRIICDVAQRMGFSGFNFDSAAEIFDEHARLSAFQNDGERAFNLQGLIGLSDLEYDRMEPVQWPVRRAISDSVSLMIRHVGTARLFTDHRFSTPDGRATFIPTAVRAPVNRPGPEYPFVLNTGRVRDHWHTMTRTGRSPKLSGHVSEPFLEVHREDAAAAGLVDGALGRVSTAWGSCVARVKTDGGVQRGTIFVPIHWNEQFSSHGRVGSLINPVVDPVSGEPEFKHTPARLGPFNARWYGFVLSRIEVPMSDVDWWTRVTGDQFTRYEIAGLSTVSEWSAFSGRLFQESGGRSDEFPDILEYRDPNAGTYRSALISDDRLQACLFVSAGPHFSQRAWLASLFEKPKLAFPDRVALLAGRAPEGGIDAGPIVCSCFGVGRNTIESAIRTRNLRTAGEVTACVRAGGNCGSCVPEIRKLLKEIVALHPEATDRASTSNRISER